MEINETAASALQKTCRACQVANLSEEIRIRRCDKCNQIYCIHFASAVDPQFCTECLSDISLKSETITKTYTHEHYDEETDTIITTEYRRRAKSLKLEGTDWLFNQRKIVNMGDDSLELAVEYHREILHLMLKEREDRKTKKMHRFAGVKLGTETVNDGTSTDTTLTVKKSRTISSTKAAATVAGVINSGQIDPAVLLKMLQDIQAKGTK